MSDSEPEGPPDLVTEFALLPGPPDPAVVRRVIETLLAQHWIAPETLGSLATQAPVPPGSPADVIVEYWSAHGSVMAEGHGVYLSFLPNRDAERNTGGVLALYTRDEVTKAEGWSARHAEGMGTIAKLLASPVARAGFETTFALNTRRITGAPQRLRGYEEGLLTLSWRNVFGPPFTQLFGDRLRTLPTETARDLGDGYWFVESPPDRAAEFVEHLGKDVFYDLEHETKPTRRPVIEVAVDARSDDATRRPPPGEYFLLYRSASGFSLDGARDVLAAAGFVSLREGAGFTAHISNGPELHVHPTDAAVVRAEIVRRAPPNETDAAALAACDAALVISVDNLEAALDETNTLIESQWKLGEASRGYLFLGWNDELQAPE